MSVKACNKNKKTIAFCFTCGKIIGNQLFFVRNIEDIKIYISWLWDNDSKIIRGMKYQK